MVQRYIEIPEAEVATCMHEHFAGDYVRYEDYAALKVLTDRLVSLRKVGTMSTEEAFNLAKAIDAYDKN